MEHPRPNKRLRVAGPPDDGLDDVSQVLASQFSEDHWASAALYAIVDDAPLSGGPPGYASSKRKANGAFPDFNDREYTDSQRKLQDLFPGSAPSARNPADRTVELRIFNPFIFEEHAEHPRLTSSLEPIVLPLDGNINENSLIKFHLHFDNPNMPERTKTLLAQQKRKFTEQMKTKAGDVSYLPRDFGRGFNLDQMDMRLFKFYRVAFCAGRTLLPETNIWLTGVPAIAEKSECVKHAMLSLAAGYVLDYAPTTKLKQKAAMHHKRAILLLGLELNKPENYEPGKEEPLLIALSLLNHEDIVNWETREKTKSMPKWYSGVQAVKTLLDKSDPGYRYHHPINVQSTSIRYAMSHYQAQSLVLSDTCAPLGNVTEDYPFPWLLEGNERDVRKITGLSGCCAKLIHVFAQITHLTSSLAKNPESLAIPAAGKIILESLTNFRQWSDLSEGYDSPEALIEACEANVDENNKVTEAGLSVALNAESYVASAQIYLLCRLFRLPRRHPEVEAKLEMLFKCVDLVPLDGPLYTAQDSLYGLAMVGLVATKETHRQMVRQQFMEVTATSRGNTPPIWRMVQNLWNWLDTDLVEDDSVDQRSIVHRIPWWESMADRIMVTEGRLSLI